MPVIGDFLAGDGVALGVIIGGLYGLLAMGFVLVYKATRVLNMAHGDLGTTAAFVLALLVQQVGWGYWPGFLTAVLTGVVIGLLVEALIIDKLRDAPRLVVLVATIGLAQLLVVASTLLISPELQGELAVTQSFPQPFELTVHVAGATLEAAEIFSLLAIASLAAGLAAFFRYTRYGIAIRATAENADNARLLGVSTRRVSLVVWGIAGGLSAVGAVMYAGTSGIATTLGVGPGLLLRALVAAVLARMTSLPRALLWGVAVGVVEQVLLFNLGNAPLIDALLFAAILVALLAQRVQLGRLGALDRSSWPVSMVDDAAPAATEGGSLAPRLNTALVFGALAFAVVLPFTVAAGPLFAIIVGISLAIGALSLTVLTGLGGQISLGQWALAGIGAFAAARVSADLGWQPWAAIVVGTAAGGVASIIIGLPALRIRGLFLAVATLGFAVGAQSWLFQADWFTGGQGGRTVERPAFATSDQAYYFIALAALLVAAAAVWSVTHSRLGRNIVAVRENESAAAALGVNVVATRLMTFVISGCLAGLGGTIALFAQQSVTGESFRVALSLQVVIVAVVGGVSSIAGAILGTAALVVVPSLAPGHQVLAALAGGGTVLVILQFLPGGLVSLLRRLRRAVLVPPFRQGPIATPPPVAQRAAT